MPPVANALVAFLICCLFGAHADPTDWVNSNYILSLPGPSVSSAAGQTVLKSAYTSSRGGPWSVTYSTIFAPSGDPKDYLSFAPYYWPDCSQCVPSHNQDDDDEDGDDAGDASDNDPRHQPSLNKRTSFDSLPSLTTHKIASRHRNTYSASRSPDPTTLAIVSTSNLFVPTAPNVTDLGINISVDSPSNVAFARKPSATNSPTKTSSCPTLAYNAPPSATWTTCTYVERDGRVNPDVRQLNDSTWINDVSTAAIALANSFALTNKTVYATTAANYISTFFADPHTGMNPNVRYGQVVRGPGEEQGSFMAIVDLRGMVKVVNAIEILRETGAPGWTWEVDNAMVQWGVQYISWLRSSSQGKKAAAAANNHGTFYCAQMTALQVLVGDLDGARQTLQGFFQGTFQNQVLASGEQPFEAIRTRPAHYRSFNIEALLVNAKLADQLGLDVWTFPSRYGATIQTAVNFALSSYSSAADAATAPAELAPHVATVAAAYGDPSGRYSAWLRQHVPDYRTKSWSLWDQPDAYAMSPNPASSPSKRSYRPSEDIRHVLQSHLRRDAYAQRRAGARKLKGLGRVRKQRRLGAGLH